MNNFKINNNFNIAVIEIFWDNIWLYLKIQCENPFDVNDAEFYFINEQLKAETELEKVSYAEGEWTVRTNITNRGDRNVIQPGTYSLCVCNKKGQAAFVKISKSIVKDFGKFSRNFLYKNRTEIYAISFFIPDNSANLLFNMHVLDSGEKKKINFSKKIKRKVKKGLNLLYCFYGFFHINKKKHVLFLSEQSDIISTNLNAVLKCMLNRKLDHEFVIETSFRSHADKKKRSAADWNRLLLKLAKADFIIIDDHVPFMDWFKISDKTQVIQVWHGGLGFKSSGYSRWGHKGCPAPESCHRQYTYGIAGGENLISTFSEVWGINNSQVLPTGMPRIDEFLDPDYRGEVKKSLYQRYNICKNKKVILFAPTYRGKNKKDASYPYELINFQEFYEFCGEEYVVLFKMHPWVKDKVPIDKRHQDRFLDVGSYPNINDLFYITDVLITDYSSNIYEFSLMKKPIIFFAFDEIQYSFSRGFHRPYQLSAPGKICYNFQELLDALRNKEFKIDKVLEYVEQNFKYVDCHSADRLIDWVILNKMPDDIRKRIERDSQKMKELKLLEFIDESDTSNM